MKQLIDKNEILAFPREDYSGFANFTYDMINKNNLDDRFDEAYQLCEDILDGLMNAIETAEVVEERETTICNCFTTMPGDYPIYQYFCGECSEWIESNMDDEEYKFCPHCGAKYERIVKCE
jgi:DNA-directed RNA polymerase subunit RPC12/RpoP